MIPTNAEIKEQIGIAVGHASMCWKEIPHGEFDSTQASNVIDNLYNYLVENNVITNGVKTNDTITIHVDFLEHLLNCLANQKYINEINADGLDCDYKKIQKETQAVIDKAWKDGMDLLVQKV